MWKSHVKLCKTCVKHVDCGTIVRQIITGHKGAILMKPSHLKESKLKSLLKSKHILLAGIALIAVAVVAVIAFMKSKAKSKLESGAHTETERDVFAPFKRDVSPEPPRYKEDIPSSQEASGLSKFIDNLEWQYVVLVGVALIAFSAISLYTGLNPRAINHFNPYSIQAYAWLNGRLDVYNYGHLEIAIFGGQYFISFPPFPSLVMLPFVARMGRHTPDHGIALVMAVIVSIYAYKLAKLYLKDKNHSLFLALFLVIGTNYMHVALWGGVWFFAQNMAFMLTLMSLYYGSTSKRWHSVLSLLFLCMAMGCRPLNAAALPVVLLLIYKRERELGSGFNKYVAHLLATSIPAVLLGVFYMALNHARFGSIFQFGHDFLPEFAEEAKFSLSRLGDNLQRVLFGLPRLNNGVLDFPMFNGHAFWLASPIVITYAIYMLITIAKAGQGYSHLVATDGTKNPIPDGHRVINLFLMLTIFVSATLLLLYLSTHRTMGGHHFGNRYTVDILPMVFLGLLIAARPLKRQFIYLNLLLFLPGFIMNLIGSIEFFSLYF